METDEVRLPNTFHARVSSAPDRSSATIVFSKVAGSGAATIAATSARCSAMPASSASRQCSGLMSPNGGRPNGSGDGRRRGLSGDTGAVSTALIAAIRSRPSGPHRDHVPSDGGVSRA